MAVIRAARPPFRSAHDRFAIAVHASFLAAGYSLPAVGSRAASSVPPASESPPPEMAAEPYRRDAQSAQPTQRRVGEAFAAFQGAAGHGNNVKRLEAQSPPPPTPNVVAPDSNGSSKPVPKVSSRSEHRSSQRAEQSTYYQHAPPRRLPRPESVHLAMDAFDQRLQRSEIAVEPYRRDAQSAQPTYRRVGEAKIVEESYYGNRAWSRDITRGNGSMHMQNGTSSQAIADLQNRLQGGIITDSGTYIKVLQTCLKQKDLFAAKQVHDCVIQSGMDKSLHVAVTIMNVYIKCGGLGEARQLFDQLEKKSVVSWNNMISGYAKSGHADSALKLFNQMRREGVEPNEITYLSILKACRNPSALKWGEEIHECIRHTSFESDVRIGTALLHMYAKCGCIVEAREVFDRLKKRNVVTWTVMIGGLAQHGCGHEAYRLFLQMIREGCEPDAIAYVSILNASASAGALEWVKDVHGHARRAGLESDLRVGNALVHMYAKSGSIDDARLVFDRMEQRDVFTWTVMIGGLADHGCGHEAYRLFLQMIREGCEPDAYTYASILNASASAGALEWVKDVHGHASRAGLESDLRVGNALVHMYAKSGSIDDALLVFDRMEQRDVFTWNVMVGGLADHGCGHEAYRLFLQMIREGCEPDAFTYASILNASASAGALEWVKDVHGHASRAGLESDLRVGNALVHMYAKSGSIEDARLVFDRMEQRDVLTWTAMIGGLAEHGCGHEALDLFGKMIADCVKPDSISFVAVLSACCHRGLVDDGRRLFSAMMQVYGIEPDIRHYNCMVDLLGRAGHLEEAWLFINDMPIEPDAITWTSLVGPCRTYGNVELSKLAAKKLLKLDPNDASPYVLLSNIYAAAGEWEKKELVRTMMQKRGVRKEPGRSWIEVDKKVHNFVVGDKSHPEEKAIYTELKKLTAKLKVEGYIPDTRLVLHDIKEEDKELALCSHSEKLAIAFGLIHIPREEPIRVWKNLRVCSDCHTATKLISKVTGREIIARDANRFHHFKDGVCSCGDYWVNPAIKAPQALYVCPTQEFAIEGVLLIDNPGNAVLSQVWEFRVLHLHPCSKWENVTKILNGSDIWTELDISYVYGFLD